MASIPAKLNFNSRLGKLFIAAVAVAFLISLMLTLAFHGVSADSGTCTAPPTDYGTDTLTVNITGAGNYYIWSRMAADNSSDGSYLMQVDTSNCFDVGSSSAKSVPVYGAGATQHFNNDSSNWLDTTTTGAVVQVNLSVGTHTIELIGNAPNLVLDRLVFTQDASCTPTGTGDNCVNPDTTPPTVSITSLTNGAILNNDSTSRPYNSSSYSVTASATDASGIDSVVFKIDGVTQYTDTNPPYNFAVNLTGLSCGNHTFSAVATDSSPNHNVASSSVTAYVTHAEDINGDCQVNYLDISALSSKYGQTSNLGRADINGDGQVNYLDISALSSKYGQ